MKKGQWVTFKTKNGKEVGIVTKGGNDIISVAYGCKGGSYMKVESLARHFTPTDAPVLDKTGIMDAYELKAFKDAGGEETMRFEAKLYKNGKLIGIASNDGCGGCNRYYHTGKGTPQDIAEFINNSKQWAIAHGEENPFEADSSWIYWFQFYRPIGETTQSYWEAK